MAEFIFGALIPTYGPFAVEVAMLVILVRISARIGVIKERVVDHEKRLRKLEGTA